MGLTRKNIPSVMNGKIISAIVQIRLIFVTLDALETCRCVNTSHHGLGTKYLGVRVSISRFSHRDDLNQGRTLARHGAGIYCVCPLGDAMKCRLYLRIVLVHCSLVAASLIIKVSCRVERHGTTCWLSASGGGSRRARSERSRHHLHRKIIRHHKYTTIRYHTFSIDSMSHGQRTLFQVDIQLMRLSQGVSCATAIAASASLLYRHTSSIFSINSIQDTGIVMRYSSSNGFRHTM
jgi:hypothetical protein